MTSSYSIVANPKLVKDILNEFSEALSKNPDAYDTADIDALLNSLYRAVNTIENKPVTH